MASLNPTAILIVKKRKALLKAGLIDEEKMASLNLPSGLKFYENELISSIQRAGSLLPLTKKANEAGLIPQEVNDSLQSMDPDVDHQLLKVQVPNVVCV